MNYFLAAGSALAIIFFFRNKSLPWPLRVVLSVVVIAAVWALWRPESFEERVARLAAPPTPKTTNEFTGCSASQRAIETRLKSPSSVRWAGCFSTTSDGVQTVRLSVDSQNSYGAMLRSQWIATVRNNRVETIVQVQ